MLEPMIMTGHSSASRGMAEWSKSPNTTSLALLLNDLGGKPPALPFDVDIVVKLEYLKLTRNSFGIREGQFFEAE